MSLLFTRELENRFFTGLRKQPWAFVFDFDGTLAALKPDPHSVRLRQEVRQTLRSLQRQFPIYVVTGRALKHVVHKLPVRTPVMGEHGAASTEPDYRLSGYELDRIRAKLWRKAINERIRSESLKSEVWVEPKEYSITVHYRHAKDPRRFKGTLARWISQFHPQDRPEVLPGKFVMNLLPSPAPNKGDALQWILKRLPKGTRVFFAGDEPTDEHAFRKLRKGDLGLFVGPKNEKTAAGYRLPSQKAFEEFLIRLGKHLTEERRREPRGIKPLRRG